MMRRWITVFGGGLLPRLILLFGGLGLGLSGCSSTQSAKYEMTALNELQDVHPQTGEIIGPKRCHLRVITLTAPINDKDFARDVWTRTDEQRLPGSVRRGLEENGLRLGVLIGGMPPSLEERFRNAASAVKGKPGDPATRNPVDMPNAVEINIPDGEQSLVSMVKSPLITLLLNHEGHTVGRDFQDVHGILRVSARYLGAKSLGIRLLPEVHHGSTARNVVPEENANPFAVQQFILQNTQTVEAFRELSTEVELQSDQILVLGCWPDRPHSLGSFFCTEVNPVNDQLQQKLIFIVANQSHLDNQQIHDLANPDHASLARQVLDFLNPLSPPKLKGQAKGDGENGASVFRKKTTPVIADLESATEFRNANPTPAASANTAATPATSGLPKSDGPIPPLQPSAAPPLPATVQPNPQTHAPTPTPTPTPTPVMTGNIDLGQSELAIPDNHVPVTAENAAEALKPKADANPPASAPAPGSGSGEVTRTTAPPLRSR